MFIGQTLNCENIDDGGGLAGNPSTVYTPWINRQGNSVVVGIDVLAMSAAVTGARDSTPRLNVYIQTKSSDSSDGSGVTTSSVVEVATTGSDTITMTNLNDLVRIKYVFEDADVGGGSAFERVLYVTFLSGEPSWATN